MPINLTLLAAMRFFLTYIREFPLFQHFCLCSKSIGDLEIPTHFLLFWKWSISCLRKKHQSKILAYSDFAFVSCAKLYVLQMLY